MNKQIYHQTKHIVDAVNINSHFINVFLSDFATLLIVETFIH